jgi:hypothetical protein
MISHTVSLSVYEPPEMGNELLDVDSAIDEFSSNKQV